MTIFLVNEIYSDGHVGIAPTIRSSLEDAQWLARTNAEIWAKHPELGISAVRIERVEILETVETIPCHAPESPA
jgi:hypothetical protein